MKKIIKIILLLFIALKSSAQMLELPKSILSPNAASLGKYGDIPMDLSTGRANVNIPLYSLNEGGIPLDISLNYDTGGVRVNDVPGWVGQNWSLNAGGIITRTVRGKGYDEGKVCANASGNPDSNWGFFYYKGDLNNLNWNSTTYLKNLIGNARDLYGNFKDYEPDLFTFNFMGFSGKFFMGNDGEWKVISNDNLKIEISNSDYILPLNINYFGTSSMNPLVKRCNCIGKIKITDDKGNYYIFGKTQNDIEFTIPSFGNQTLYNIFSNAWYLSEVYNKFGNKIYTLNYERGDDQGQLFISAYFRTIRRDRCDSFYGACGPNTIDNNLEILAYGDIIKPVFLQTITTKSGNVISFNSTNHNGLKYNISDPIIFATVYRKSEPYNSLQPSQAWSLYNKDFWYSVHTPLNNGDPITENPIYETGNYFDSVDKVITEWKWRKLTNITVKNSNNTNLKKIDLLFNNNSNQRLRLDKLTIDSQYNYSFEYQNFDLLPSYTSHNIDHFGYYNGKNYNITAVDVANHYINRSTDANFVKYGSLTKIIYPTGGYTLFEYEPHDYSSYVNNDRNGTTTESGIIGGLRIRKKTDLDNNGQNLIKEYSYKNNIFDTSSNGILLLKNLYYSPNHIGYTLCGSLFYEGIFSMNSIVPLSNFSGTQIEYPKVIETQLDSNGENIGITSYNYYGYNDYKDSFSGTVQYSFSIFDPHTDFSFKRGKLRLKEFRNKSNQIVLQEEYNYFSNDLKKSKAFSYNGTATCFTPGGVGDGNPAIKGTAYEIYYSDNNLVSKKTRTYNSTGEYLEETENYKYIDRENFGDNFLRSKTKSTTNLVSTQEEYQYTFDKSNITPYNTLTNRREFSVIKTDKTLSNVPISSSQVDYAQLPIYDKNGNTTSINQIFPQKFSEAKGTNAFEEKLIVDKYDADGNVLQAHKTNGKYIFYFYGYNNRYPIMKIEGAETISTGATSFSTQASQLRTLMEDPSSTMTQIIQKQFTIVGGNYPDHQITCYTYKPDVGVTSIMNPNASVEFYNYDSIGRLINIKDINGKVLKDFSYEFANQ